jgi:L-amino acid N-acyltransferase YncA
VGRVGARIFEEGIRTGVATFETEVPTWEAWVAVHLPEHRLVAEREGRVAGWAALAPVSSRSCYGGVAEISACAVTDSIVCRIRPVMRYGSASEFGRRSSR